MNNDDSNKRKNDFFKGESSLQDEKFLKENSTDPYFLALEKERSETTDWSFEDFMAIAETKEKKMTLFTVKRFAYWSAAAVVLVILGNFLFFNTTKAPINQLAATPIKKQQTKAATELTLPAPVSVANEQENVPVKRSEKQKKETPIPVEDQYNPEYVVINGKPVYNLEEALELTKSSINMLASNVEKSVSNMENVKHLSINF